MKKFKGQKKFTARRAIHLLLNYCQDILFVKTFCVRARASERASERVCVCVCVCVSAYIVRKKVCISCLFSYYLIFFKFQNIKSK
jgi:hypothetical protein